MTQLFRRRIALFLVLSSTLFLAGCGPNLFDRAMNFWSLSICGALVVILNIVALIELAGDARSTRNKVLWALLIIFAPLLGCILYFVFGRRA